MTHDSERRVSERRDVDAGAILTDKLIAGLVGFLFAIVMNYFTVGASLNKIDRRLVRIETVVCSPSPTPCPNIGDR